MKCSKLNHDLSVNNIIDNDRCNCGLIKTAFHYFFECPQYTILKRGALSLKRSVLKKTHMLTPFNVKIVSNYAFLFLNNENKIRILLIVNPL